MGGLGVALSLPLLGLLVELVQVSAWVHGAHWRMSAWVHLSTAVRGPAGPAVSHDIGIPWFLGTIITHPPIAIPRSQHEQQLVAPSSFSPHRTHSLPLWPSLGLTYAALKGLIRISPLWHSLLPPSRLCFLPLWACRPTLDSLPHSCDPPPLTLLCHSPPPMWPHFAYWK